MAKQKPVAKKTTKDVPAKKRKRRTKAEMAMDQSKSKNKSEVNTTKNAFLESEEEVSEETETPIIPDEVSEPEQNEPNLKALNKAVKGSSGNLMKKFKNDVLKKFPAKDNFVASNGYPAFQSLDTDTFKIMERVHSGSYWLDYCFGGGIPVGRFLNLFGKESGGKSLLAYWIAGWAYQSRSRNIFIGDAETSAEQEYVFPTFGLNLEDEDRVMWARNTSANVMLGSLIEGIDKADVEIAVIDSFDNIITVRQESNEVGDSQMGFKAYVLADFFAKVRMPMLKNKAILIGISQLRMKVGASKYEDPETVSGGKALLHAADLRVKVSRKEKLLKGKTMIGQRIKVKVFKSKVCPPFREAEIDFYFDGGIDRVKELVEVGGLLGVIEKGGAWYSYKHIREQGSAKFKEALESPKNKNVLQELEIKVTEAIRNDKTKGEAVDENSFGSILHDDEIDN